MSAWLRHHLHSFARCWARIQRSPFASFFNAVAIGMAVALPLVGYLSVHNVEAWVPHFQAEPQVSVFLANDITRDGSAAIGKSLGAQARVRKVEFVSREAALDALRRSVGLGDLASVLGSNPLPDAFIVTMASPDPGEGEQMVRFAQGLKGVAQAHADFLWSQRLDAILHVARTGLLLVGLALGLALVAVTFNTIRLQLLTESDEIEISRLIGATDAYVRRPFLYWAGVMGLLGGLLGLGLTAGALYWIGQYASQLASLYGVAAPWDLPTWRQGLAVLALSGALGWLGGLLSVSHHLCKIS